MNIKLYKNTSEAIRLDKSTSLELVLNLDGNLRDSASITNPIVMIDTKMSSMIVGSEGEIVVDDDNRAIIDRNVSSSLLVCNYAYIEDFNRYYFIDNIVSVRSDLWALSLRVDPLMSFKNDIRSMEAYVARNENAFNADIVDNEIVFENDSEVETTNYSNTFFTNPDQDSQRFVLITTGVIAHS